MGVEITRLSKIGREACIFLATFVACSVLLAQRTPAVEFLSTEEREWLQSHRTDLVIGSDSNYHPYLFIEDGKLSGVWGDLVHRIESELQVAFPVKEYASFQKVLDGAKARETALIACLVDSEERRSFLRFTEPVFVVTDVILARKDSPYKTLSDLHGKRVGVVEGYSVQQILAKQTPELILVPVENESDGLHQLGFGKIDAMIADTGVASWQTKELGLTNIHVLEPLGIEDSELAFAIRSDWPELQVIIQKALDRISVEERTAIIDKWVQLRIAPSHRDLRPIWTGIAIASGLIGILVATILVWNRSLRRLVARRTHELEAELGERQRAESENARLAIAISQVDEHLVIVDRHKNIEYVNPRFERDSGLHLGDLTGKPVDLLFSLEDGTSLDSVWETIKMDEVWRGKLLQKDRQQQIVQLESTAAPIRDCEQAVSGYILCCRNRSHEEALERQLQQAQRIRSIGTLAGGIAHDFNNLLTPIICGTELVQMEEISEEAHELLEAVSQAGLRAKELVGQILTFGREGTGKKEPINLARLTEEAISFLRSTLPANITISANIPSNFPMMSGDLAQLQSVIMNIGANAFHAMEEKGGTLSFVLTEHTVTEDDARMNMILQAGSYAYLSVTDTGTGMSRDVRDRIFDPYFTTKIDGKGTGLGLATAHGIVRGHGGDIQVFSMENDGSTFIVLLPIEAEHGVPEESELDTEDIQPGKGECILLVDDDPAVLRSHKAMLTRLNYRVVETGSADEALAYYRMNQDDIDLVLTDFSMPGKNGIDLLHDCHDLNPDQPVVIITGGSQATEEVSCLTLRKPVQLKELGKVLRQALAYAPVES
jgi:PAS domain S-box-containing protein